MAGLPLWVGDEKYQKPEHRRTYRREVTEIQWGPVEVTEGVKEADWSCSCSNDGGIEEEY